MPESLSGAVPLSAGASPAAGASGLAASGAAAAAGSAGAGSGAAPGSAAQATCDHAPNSPITSAEPITFCIRVLLQAAISSRSRVGPADPREAGASCHGTVPIGNSPLISCTNGVSLGQQQ